MHCVSLEQSTARGHVVARALDDADVVEPVLAEYAWVRADAEAVEVADAVDAAHLGLEFDEAVGDESREDRPQRHTWWM